MCNIVLLRGVANLMTVLHRPSQMCLIKDDEDTSLVDRQMTGLDVTSTLATYTALYKGLK
jgi:hypothetical protein